MEVRTNHMTTVSQVLEKLRIKRYDNEFIMEGEFFTTPNGIKYTPENLTIIKTFRFEGDSDPADSSILYLIEGNDGLIGYSLDSYGAYSDHEDEEGYDNFIRQVKVENRDDQLTFEL